MIRNMSIRSKLIAILLTPLVALTVVASLGIGASVARGVRADRVKDATAFAVDLSVLVDHLQGERDLSTGYVASGRRQGWGNVIGQRVKVNNALASFRNSTRALDDQGNQQLQGAVNGALARLGRLGAERARIGGDASVTPQDVLDFYTDIIGSLIGADLAIAGQTDNRELLQNVFAFVQFTNLKETTSYERGFVFGVLSAGRFAPGQYQRLAALVGAEDTWRAQFLGIATPQQRELFSRTVAGQNVQGAEQLRGRLLAAPGGTTGGIDPQQWFDQASAKLGLLRSVEIRLASDVRATADAVQRVANREALLYTIVLTLVLLLTVGLSLLLARSMAGPLRQLTETANDVAVERLPRLVDRLQHSTDPRDLDVQPEPVPVSSTDEIGQVSAAFNKVHSTAIQVATEQAALRRSIGDMFLNLARRSQSLIDRQLELIDDLERNEADPDALENLFRLDHLATRMRRNAEDLIVLSGSEPARRWSQPVPLVDVVRAALAEVEDYDRVELLPIDDVGVAGQAVSDAVHLLAELIENATAFSPPGTKVQIAGQQVSNGYVVEIEDRGLGMSDEELVEANERLANPPMVDFALSRMLGLYVVGRLAQRYGIKVQLRHSWYGGITALALLPPNLIVRSVIESLEPPAARRDRAELAPPAQPTAEPTGAVAAEGAAGDGGAGGDHLPIFEAARSDWFESGVGGAHLPLRRHAAQQPGNGSGGQPTANGVGRPADGPSRPADAPVLRLPPGGIPAAGPPSPVSPPPTVAPPPPVAPEPPVAPVGPASEPSREPPARVGRPPRPGGRPTPPAAEPAAASLQAASVQTTKAGLPRRVPRANLAPGMVAAQQAAAAAATRPSSPAAAPAAPSASSRSPEEVRSMLSSYRSGLERGRMMAAGEDAAGGNVPTPSRSDDDATQ